MGAKIVIVGAGWRVSNFVVPALYSLGVGPADLLIVRRRPTKADGILSDISTTMELSNLKGDIEITVNCVPKRLLLSMQMRLLDQFPNAIHFCDTPVIYRLSDYFRARRMGRSGMLFSLEDWPFMPNLIPFLELAASRPEWFHWRFEHVGVANHFFSVSRAALRIDGQQASRVATRRGEQLYDRRRKDGSTCVLKGPKNDTIAKISLWNRTRLLEDFFELSTQSESAAVERSNELVWRQLREARLSYFVGPTSYHEVTIPSKISSPFIERGSRRAVHELDKVAALISIFDSTLGGNPQAYPFYHSAQDAFLDRISTRTRVAWALGRA